MLSRIVLDNFKSFDHIDMDFTSSKSDKKAKNLIMIYGENGIGKSSIIESIKFLKDSFESIERLKSFDRIFADINKNDISFKNSFYSLLDHQTLSDLIKRFKTVDSEGLMKMRFEFLVSSNKYVYESSYDFENILEEKMTINGNILFSVTNKKITLVSSYFNDENFNSLILRYYNLYYGKHSLLACINQAGAETSAKVHKRFVSKEVYQIFAEISDILVVTNSSDEFDSPRLSFVGPIRVDGILPNLITGLYSESKNKLLEKSKLALSMFYSSLYSNIVGVDYDISDNESEKKRYNLVFLERLNNEVVRIPFNKESTGTKKLVSLFSYLFAVSTRNCIIAIDEIDNGINDILLQTIIERINDSLKGQLIFTTHDTLLLNYLRKKNTYILNREEAGVSFYPLSDFGRKIQSGTDIVRQYIKGLYGGVPQTGLFSMEYIIDGLSDDE